MEITNKDVYSIGFNCEILLAAKGHKLGAMRHLKNIVKDTEELKKEREEIKTLKPDAKEEEIEQALNEFDNEQYKKGFSIIPVEWFDSVENDKIQLYNANQEPSGFTYPFYHLNYLIEKGVVQ